jgi:alpha-mannosidase
MWPLREAIRKCARTFSTALDYMRDYPEYVFGCSQAQHYAWMKHHYPQIYEGMKEAVARGQWEPIGSMWVEADCNLASGESLVRQILKGKQFFRREFGYETRDAWIPDVFGYSAALPQIFRKCGIDFFVTQKISWNQFNQFPHHSFYWEGIDGTRIFTHFPPADTYNAEVDARSLVRNVNNFREHGLSDRSLYIYGYGDGGGGPTVEMIERIRRLENFDGLPCVTPQKVSEFLPLAKVGMSDIPVWVGELYLELHRGTYTTQARTKRNNRQCELLLRETEFFDAVSALLHPGRRETAATPSQAVYDVTGRDEAGSGSHAVALDRSWKLLLLNQFHDIIPGSSIGWVYEDAERDYATLRTLCASVLDPSLDAIDGLIDRGGMRQPVRIANSLGWERSEVVDLPDGSQRFVTVPACGYVVIDAAVQPEDQPPPVIATRNADSIILDNGLLRAVIDSAGLLSSLRNLRADREVLAAGARGNLFQLHPDTPNAWDAWDIDVFYREQQFDLVEGACCEIEESTPLRAVAVVSRKFRNSTILQRIVLRAGSSRIDFVTEVDWRERHSLLKVAFPIAVRSARATYEIQYGHVERPTHYNTSWDMARFEVCAHKWAALSETGYGVALLNDCKYGYDIHGQTMRLSLLRSPTSPDREADQGRHHFTYSLYPHQGDVCSAKVIEEAYQLNVPLRVAALDQGGGGGLAPKASWFSVNRPGIIIEAVKCAEDGDGIIVRLYESHGSRGSCVLSTSLSFTRLSATNLIENGDEPLAFSEGRAELCFSPFEIVTLRFR